MRTREQAEIEYNWLSLAKFGRLAGGFSRQTVKGWVDEGLIRDVQKTPAGHYRIPESELVRWKEEHAVTPAESDAA